MAELTWTHPALAAPILSQIRACERLLAITDNMPSVDDEPPVFAASPAEKRMQGVFEEFARTTKTFRAALVLASNGFGPQVHMLGAVIFESAMTVVWGCDHEDLASYYAELHAEYGSAQYEARRGAIQGNTADAASFDREDEARALFGDRSDQSLWTGHRSVEELVEDLIEHQEDHNAGREIRLFYEANYRWSAQLTTATGIANHSHREFIEDRMIFAPQLGPSSSQVGSGLRLASEAYRIAADALAEKYFPDILEDLHQAGGLLWRSRRDPSLLASLREDSPCPCERPGAMWASCHGWTLRLGTHNYVPLRDSDVSMPSPPVTEDDVLPAESVAPLDSEADAQAVDRPRNDREPTGPVYFTFTFRLPFPLGVPEGTVLMIQLLDSFASQDDIAHFGSKPFVRIRNANLPTGGVEIWPQRAVDALEQLYGLRIEDADYPKYGESHHFEQWITVETPGARLSSEDSSDAAYAFHRCFHALNSYLLGLSLALRGSAIHTVATQDLGRVVLRGYYDQTEVWRYQGPLLMHPEAWPEILTPAAMDVVDRSVASTIRDLHNGRPFIAAATWYRRAERASRTRGDYAACVVHLQTAAETMLYDLWRMMLVDRGESSGAITKKLASLRNNYKRLLTSEVPRLLGGSWDITQTSRPVGQYWHDVYDVRNRIVHSGGDAGPVEADKAAGAYKAFRDYISELLWQRHGQYPRTLIAKVGANGLERRGWLAKNMRDILAEYTETGIPFHWPADRRAVPPGLHIG